MIPLKDTIRSKRTAWVTRILLIANLIAFLASDKARHITGEVIKVDGGQYI